MLFSRVQEPWQFYAAFLVIAVGASMSGFLTATFAAVHWFERRRGTAISLASAGFAVGGMCVPLTVLALESLGGRTTALLSGVLIIAAGLPLARLYRHHPHELGLEPDGGPPAAARRATGDLPAAPAHRDFTLGEAVRTPAFWLISLGHASALFVVVAMSVHLVSHLRDSQG